MLRLLYYFNCQLARVQEAICGTKARKVHEMAVGGVVQEGWCRRCSSYGEAT